VETRETRQLTEFSEYDIHYPSMGVGEIVFENGGDLYLLNLATEQLSKVPVQCVTDQTALRAKPFQVGGKIESASISPSGKRVVFEARGEVFDAPASDGVTWNLTNSSGAAERTPEWSPDGRSIAYFSDATGEYELWIRPADGKGIARQITSLGAGFRYRPQWSPDSKHLVWIDSAMRIQMCEVATGTVWQVDSQLFYFHGDLTRFRVAWSKDGHWMTWAKDLPSRQSAIALYEVTTRSLREVTSGYYSDSSPTIDPDGKYLYYISDRYGDPLYASSDPTWIYNNGEQIIAVPLRKDVPSPLAPKIDEETGTARQSGLAEKSPSPAMQNPASPTAPKPLEIDFEGFESRGVILPMRAGRYEGLIALPGRLLFRSLPRVGSTGTKSVLTAWELEKREEKSLAEDVSDVSLAAGGKHLLIKKGGAWTICATDGQNSKVVPTGGLETVIDPVDEWRQLFHEAWRLQRDYFYDPHMHLVRWAAVRDRYAALLPDCATRSDVNFLIGEMIGELNSSHTYRSGGDLEAAPSRGVGYLGCDFELAANRYRIARILDVAPWDSAARSPLRAPGVNVQEGDYLLAVNRRAIDPSLSPWASFAGLAEETVVLTVNREPDFDGSREVVVTTLKSEARLRQLAWVEQNRRRVDEITGGRVGYIYVPSTAVEGQNELFRGFRAFFEKPGLIIDERWNSGGQIPDRFVELIGRQVTNYWGVRDGLDWQTPRIAHRGPKAMLMNGWSGSGGDCFPWLFREANLGPLIGMRTWGGLIGMTGAPGLIDGGKVTVPTFSIYDSSGRWIIEGDGVSPDIAVVDDPTLLAVGIDPQLERAAQEVLAKLRDNPRIEPNRPPYPNRAR
jgi:tricorn protease